MSSRSTLRTALLGLVAAGAVLAPAASAVASDSPKPAATAADRTATPSPVPEGTEPTEAPQAAEPSTAPAPARAEADRTPALPRGGVAAGERPVVGTDAATTLYGPAAGAVLLAGVATFVLRRRSAAHRNG
ncbi:hypothetical protein [Streptomyces sp. B1I3]|uniref:hypothetical protein n=1 Tax=Streptomyces sp. B1I3 TaxID=3042264 RepID=UPI0027800C89|nr:hypothetical protein [Streptomyces sp. B1I3]MDQ0792842.1 cytoskeletal protein RodZ [Streptomyces sp. B1I3]